MFLCFLNWILDFSPCLTSSSSEEELELELDDELLLDDDLCDLDEDFEDFEDIIDLDDFECEEEEELLESVESEFKPRTPPTAGPAFRISNKGMNKVAMIFMVIMILYGLQ